MLMERIEKPKLRALAIVDQLEAIQLWRILSDEESELLERSLRRIGPKRDIWRWSEKEDRKLVLLIKRRGYSLRIKPFQRNDEVQRIALDMGRSYLAVHKRIQRLRKKHGLAAQPMVYEPSTPSPKKSKRVPHPDVTGMVSAKDALAILQKRCPRLSAHVLARWRLTGGGPPFKTYIGFGTWYSEKGLAKFPLEQLMAEAKDRQTGWVFHTVKMDPDYECPSAKNGRKG